MFHHNPQPLWIFGIASFRFLEVNDAALHLYGYTRKEFLKLSILNIQHTEDLEKLHQNLKALKTSQLYKEEFQHLKKNGELLYVEISAYKVEMDNQDCVLAIPIDITERKSVQRKLKKALSKINQTLEGITDGFLTFNDQREITYYNKAAEQISGIDRRHLLNKRPEDKFPALKNTDLYRLLEDSLKNHKTVKFTYFFSKKNKWISINAYPSVEGLAVCFQDITEMKLIEQDNLNKNRSLNEVAHMNSHVLRRPIANILGLINVLDAPENYKDQLLLEVIEQLKQCGNEVDHILQEINKKIDHD